MSWRDLLPEANESLIFPWVGGRSLRVEERTWFIEGKLPKEHGWRTFSLRGRKAVLRDEDLGKTNAPPIAYSVRGYLVGDRFVADGASVNIENVLTFSEPIHLLEDGIDRFARVKAGRMFDTGPLIYECLEMPIGPEDGVLRAFFDRKENVDHVPGVSPALDVAFRMESFQRAEADRVRAELERIRKEEEAKLALEARRQKLVEQLGDGAGRRAMAAVDFGEAARAALAVGGAEYLDHRKSAQRGEMVVRFRLGQRQFECVVSETTLRVIDSGICLVDHRTQERGDTKFTLESLPGVILGAQKLGVLHVFRHVGDDDDRHDRQEDREYRDYDEGYDDD